MAEMQTLPRPILKKEAVPSALGQKQAGKIKPGKPPSTTTALPVMGAI